MVHDISARRNGRRQQRPKPPAPPPGEDNRQNRQLDCERPKLRVEQNADDLGNAGRVERLVQGDRLHRPVRLNGIVGPGHHQGKRQNRIVFPGDRLVREQKVRGDDDHSSVAIFLEDRLHRAAELHERLGFGGFDPPRRFPIQVAFPHQRRPHEAGVVGFAAVLIQLAEGLDGNVQMRDRHFGVVVAGGENQRAAGFDPIQDRGPLRPRGIPRRSQHAQRSGFRQMGRTLRGGGSGHLAVQGIKASRHVEAALVGFMPHQQVEAFFAVGLGAVGVVRDAGADVRKPKKHRPRDQHRREPESIGCQTIQNFHARNFNKERANPRRSRFRSL